MAKCLGRQNFSLEVPVSTLPLTTRLEFFSVVPGSTPSMHL